MVMVKVGGFDAVSYVNVGVAGDRSGFEHVERVIVHERNDTRDLGDHEQCQDAAAKAADRSKERHEKI